MTYECLLCGHCFEGDDYKQICPWCKGEDVITHEQAEELRKDEQ